MKLDFLYMDSKEHYLHQEVYSSYEKCFSENTRRSKEKFEKLYPHPNAKLYALLEETTPIGYILLWELSIATFVEHFEIFSSFRGKGLGSRVIASLKDLHSRIVLEIEPLDKNKDSERRFAFYEKEGFSILDPNYIQPAYGPEKESVPLVLLSNFPFEKPRDLIEEIYDIVYR